VSDLLSHVDRSIQTRRLFRPGQRILVAVSGGVDSMVLLHLLHELALRHCWQLTAAHLNHQLRGRSSEADEQLVRRTALELKVPLLAGRAAVLERARAGKLSVEMAARELRHDFLARTAKQRHIPAVALAHHADDQLELFFLRLLRGSGGEGLAGMKWRTPSASDAGIQLVRPLLDQPKAVLVEYAVEQGIRYREDASNAMLDFQRNRIRHELLPLLRDKYQPALNKTISRVMEIVGAEADFAVGVAEEWLARMGNPKSEVRPPSAVLLRRTGSPKEVRSPKSEDGGAFSQRCLSFDQLPLAVQRRCVQVQLMGLGIVPDYELVEQLRTRADRPVEVTRAQAPGGARAGGAGQKPTVGAAPRTGGTPVLRYAVRDRSGWVHLQVFEPEEFNSGSVEIEVGDRTGEVEFDGARIWWRIASRGATARPTVGLRHECFDADRVGSPVWLRHWRPGDRFQPIGMACPVKLQDFFTNKKVPRARRRQLIVATTAEGVVFWVEGLRISERFKLTKRTIRRLQWRWKRL
jgi:tRNA(Ile)-lysidine synthase